MIDNYVLYKNIPSLDLHGETRFSARVLVLEFINNNLYLRNRLIKIVHGKGTYTLRDEVHDILRRNKDVIDYKLDIFNDGVTIVELKIK